METEETVEYDELQDMPEFQDAVQSAQTGIFEHTLFEIWEHQINELIALNSGKLEIPFVDSVLRQWPWLSYTDVQKYRDYRGELLQEFKDALQSSYPKPQELLFQEAEDDWADHKEAYLEVICQWTALAQNWENNWDVIPASNPAKGILHAAIADMMVLVGGPNALAENLRDLKGFEIQESDGEWIQARTRELIGLSDD